MSKAVLSGWISFLWSQVIQSVAVNVIVLVRSVGRKPVDDGRSLALQQELSVRSWDESATHRRREGEKAHTCLDGTYRCARIRPREIGPFACLFVFFSWNCGALYSPVSPPGCRCYSKQTNYTSVKRRIRT